MNESGITPWLVLRTRSRHECIVENALLLKQIDAYLPKHKVVRQWQGRRKSLEMPLFPGYVFVRPSAEQYEGIRYIRGSCGLVLAADSKPATMSEQDLGAVRKLVDNLVDLSIDANLVKGQRVKIIAGPLMGIEGELVMIKQQCLLVINVELVGCSVRVEVGREAIAAV